MILIGVGLVIMGWGAGVWMGVLWTDYTLEATRIKHKQEMDEIFEEVKRCRAQVAALIGKE